MSVRVASQPTFWQSVPFFFGSSFKKTYPTQDVPGDWCHVSVKKLDSEGKPIKKLGSEDKPIEKIFHYVMENSTGDLYGLQGAPSRIITSLRSAAILTGILPYTICMIAWRLINFLADIATIIINAPSQIASDFQLKGMAIALLNGIVTPLCEALRSLAENIERIVVAPFYAIAMGFAALYGIVIPYEGMKRISAVEKSWHGNVSYRSDIRYLYGSWRSTTLFKDFSAARSGYVFYLGLCMQKRGNLHEIIQGKNRFTLVGHPSK